MNGAAGNGTKGERADDLPPRLVEDMIALDALRGDIPESVNRIVLARARERLASRRRGNVWVAMVRRALDRRWSACVRPLAAAAATAVLLIFVWNGIDTHRLIGGRSEDRVRISEDLDGNGQVDIADAFHLARALAGDSPRKAEWDVNQDGVVGRDDVEAIARAAVRLSRREHR